MRRTQQMPLWVRLNVKQEIGKCLPHPSFSSLKKMFSFYFHCPSHRAMCSQLSHLQICTILFLGMDFFGCSSIIIMRGFMNSLYNILKMSMSEKELKMSMSDKEVPTNRGQVDPRGFVPLLMNWFFQGISSYFYFSRKFLSYVSIFFVIRMIKLTGEYQD